VASFASDPPVAWVEWTESPRAQNSRVLASMSGTALSLNGAWFTVGIHTLSYSVLDAGGFAASCTFRVSVLYPTADAETPARGQLSLRFVTTDVLALQSALKAAIATALQVSEQRITIVSVVAAFNRTDVVLEFAPRAPTYYAGLTGTSRRLLAVPTTSDASEASELLAALYEHVAIASSPLHVTPIGALLVSSSFVNCSDALSNLAVERASGCNKANITSLVSDGGVGFQCPLGCVPLAACGLSSSSSSDDAFEREWRAVVITSAVWLALLLLLALLHYCGCLACTRHRNAGAVHGAKQPPVVPWPSVRDTSFRPLAPDDQEDAGDLRFHH